MIAIVDVCGANLASLANALKRLKVPYQLTHNGEEIYKASHVILPGVGSASYGMNALRKNGLVEVISSLKQPLLGICLGMQLLLDKTEEGSIECLGLVPGTVTRLPQKEGYPIPHMGWNQLQWCKKSHIQHGLNDTDYVYFVHSYALCDTEYTLAYCQHSHKFTAILHKNNVWGMQFHPEKSAETGMKILRNFVTMNA